MADQQQPGQDPLILAGNQSHGIIAGNLTVTILATIAVALRVLARRAIKTGMAADDYVILIALVIYQTNVPLASRAFTNFGERKAVRMGNMRWYCSGYAGNIYLSCSFLQSDVEQLYIMVWASIRPP